LAHQPRQRRAAHPRHENQGHGKTDDSALPTRLAQVQRDTDPDGHDELEHQQGGQRQEPLRADGGGGA
jgi:hypothetical protein